MTQTNDMAPWPWQSTRLKLNSVSTSH